MRAVRQDEWGSPDGMRPVEIAAPVGVFAEVVDCTTADVAATVRCLRPGGILVDAQSAWTRGMRERAAEPGVRASGFLVEPGHVGLAALADLVREGALSVHVGSGLPLSQAVEAPRFVESGRTVGKIVLTAGGAA
ncbi:zinc-binding dehydrogenase [Amycolatopsis sp. cg9]|uniref:zinc-binding dehydrogenase n=1 Tax=Amycolatopsis sp. cg9 TaxID=3238801 RepID=UPI0035265030